MNDLEFALVLREAKRSRRNRTVSLFPPTPEPTRWGWLWAWCNRGCR